MTKELVEKFKAHAAERKQERDSSTNRAEMARKRLQEIGYLDENGAVTEAYSQEVTKSKKGKVVA